MEKVARELVSIAADLEKIKIAAKTQYIDAYSSQVLSDITVAIGYLNRMKRIYEELAQKASDIGYSTTGPQKDKLDRQFAVAYDLVQSAKENLESALRSMGIAVE